MKEEKRKAGERREEDLREVSETFLSCTCM